VVHMVADAAFKGLLGARLEERGEKEKNDGVEQRGDRLWQAQGGTVRDQVDKANRKKRKTLQHTSLLNSQETGNRVRKGGERGGHLMGT